MSNYQHFLRWSYSECQHNQEKSLDTGTRNGKMKSCLKPLGIKPMSFGCVSKALPTGLRDHLPRAETCVLPLGGGGGGYGAIMPDKRAWP